MHRTKRSRIGLILIAAMVCLPLTAAAVELDDGRGDVAKIFHGSTAIQFDPLVEAERWVLTLTGPCGPISQQFDPKDEIFFDIRSLEDDPDGIWTWELHRLPSVDPKVREALEASRGTGEEQAVLRSFRNKGLLPEGPLAQSGSFSVRQGVIIDPETGDEKTVAGEFPVTSAGTGAANVTPATPQAGEMVTKQVISGDLTVYNSLCVGFDCAASETFGADTIRLKENNLRIHFDDTSTAGSFPSNDWRILVNDQANGGLARFSIEDTTASRIPFTIEAGASSNSIYADNGGRVGFGTSNPVVELHSRNGDTPALRLEQDTSSGFGAQVWDIAGNETSFFIRDATNGSTLPFRIFPGSPSNSLSIRDGNVGIGTTSPGADGLEIVRTGAVEQRIMFRLNNNGAPQTELANIDSGITWRFGQNDSGDFVINDTADLGTAEMRITTSGNVFVNGGQVHPDYVFAPDYELMSLAELERFVTQNRHLPGVQSASERAEEGGVNITALPLTLLEKVEELTLHTIRQEKRIDQLTVQNAELLETLEALRTELDR